MRYVGDDDDDDDDDDDEDEDEDFNDELIPNIVVEGL
jgi:hypothetical protein